MPVNRNALLRYKTIDKCLQNRYRKWTLENLIDECSEALYEYEGIDKGISKRTVQLDIQMMRSDKLGYNAPIIVYDNKYYTYEDPDYSITNIPLTDQDLEHLSETVEFLKQFKGFSHFNELDSMVQKLEDHVYSRKNHQKPVIDFEKNENLKGLEFLDVLYKTIVRQKAVEITYQSFKARQPSSFIFHSYLLKEFRNRWFVIGTKKAKKPLLTLALDRIISVNHSDARYIHHDNFDAAAYFRDVIGVTVSPNQKPEKVVLFITNKHAKYVITKPLHKSQKIIEKDGYGITVELEVQHNFELEKEILGLGDGAMVIAPEKLKRNIKIRLNNSVDLYNTSLNPQGVLSIKQKLAKNGYALINNMYSKRNLKDIEAVLDKSPGSEINSTINLHGHEKLMQYLTNKNLTHITNLFPSPPQMRCTVLHQPTLKKLMKWGQNFSENELTVLVLLTLKKIKSLKVQVIPGSHKRKMNKEEIKLLTENSTPVGHELLPGAALICHQMLTGHFVEDLEEKKLKLLVLEMNSPAASLGK